MCVKFIHLLILSAIFCELVISTSFAQHSIVRGTVKDGDALLGGATVSVGNKSFLTDSKGEFEIRVNAQNGLLVVTHTGFKRMELAFILKPGETKSFDINMIRDGLLGEVVILSSRSLLPRELNSTPVPVDVIFSKELINTGQVSLTQMLTFVAPSFNTSRQMLNEPSTLRGLDPDHVLILLNGIRFHNTAWLNNGNVKGQLGRGSVGNDLNSIPFSAIEKIELLRDGASAQYGSDAIAGVINIRLKESVGEKDIHLHAGQFYAGDGLKVSLGFNGGVNLRKKGFLNYSGDIRYQAPTFRGGEYEGTVYKLIAPTASRSDSMRLRAQDDSLIKVNGFNRQVAVSNVGINEVNCSGFLVNGGYPLNDHIDLFFTATINYRQNLYEGAYRFPKNKNQVNTFIYPNGFKVRIKPSNWDFSTIAGVKGRSKNNWHWEFSNAYGANSVVNNVENTNNASQQFLLGKDAPTSFYLGTNLFRQLTNDLNFTRDLSKEVSVVKSFKLSLGGEWRHETYQKKAGEQASWDNYDSTYTTNAGSQGFVGTSTDNIVDEKQNVIGSYIDLEADVNNHLLIDLGGRYEYYNDFGGNLAGKLAALYKFSDRFSLRASINNGFRAPSMQQRFSNVLQIVWTTIDGIRVPGIQGTVSWDSEIGKALGVRPLEPERSLNLGTGAVGKLSSHLSFAIDLYWIEIKNRIVLSGLFRKTNPYIARLLSGKNVDLVQFYANAIDTRTKGIDLVLNGNWQLGKASLDLSLAGNLNRNELVGNIKTTNKLPAEALNLNSMFGDEEMTRLEKGQPQTKFILTGELERGKMAVIFRNTYFGETANVFVNTIKQKDSSFYEHYGGKIISDLSISYSPTHWLTVTIGANNIFDVYPDRIKNYLNTSEGILLYCNEASPFGFNGGYYFVSTSFKF